MEKQRKRSTSTSKKNRKRKTDESCTRYNGVHLQYASKFDALFSILVAALANFHKQPSLLPLINKSLAKLRRSHIQTPIISLFPTLLASKYTSIASCGADIVGSASLLSLEMNEEIASDSETVKALVSALGSSKRRVLIAACNAVLDVGTTCIGRERLLHFCALEALMWEGFFHVALWNWNLKKRQPCLGSVYDVGVALLHAAIGLIGDSDTTFRKACLVAGISSSACSSDWLNLNLEIFYCLVDKIDTGSKFSEALSKVEDALKKNEDPFQRIRWLQILGDKTNEGLDCYMPFREIMNSFPLLAQDIYEIECVFMQIKSRFCSQIIFEDVKQSYMKLLEKYKKVRKQYKNGMISLHYGS